MEMFCNNTLINIHDFTLLYLKKVRKAISSYLNDSRED